MTDDIVTRLKNIYTMGQLGIVYEAADEIMDLRAELAEFKRQYKALMKDRDDWKIIAENLTALQDSPEWDLAILRFERKMKGVFNED